MNPSGEFAFLFVCSANVCRSPLAEELMNARLEATGEPIVARSASTESPRRMIHPTILDLLDGRGLTVEPRQGQPISESLVESSDLILTMTGDHAIHVATRFRGSAPKVFMLDHFAQVAPRRQPGASMQEWVEEARLLPRSYPNQPGAVDVVDPIGRSDAVFSDVADHIERCIDQIVRSVGSWI